jgi:cell division septation protein DedD
MVGTALYNGDGVSADPVTAYAYVSRAAAQGLAPAQATLADMDAAMPLEQRQKGVALAQAMAGAKKPAPAQPPAKAAVGKPAPLKPTAARPAAVAAKSVVPAGGKWRIQLGAFGQKKSAETLFGKLSGKLGGRQAYYVPAGAIVRLQVGPYESRASASAACSSLAPQPCFAVAAP